MATSSEPTTACGYHGHGVEATARLNNTAGSFDTLVLRRDHNGIPLHFEGFLSHPGGMLPALRTLAITVHEPADVQQVAKLTQLHDLDMVVYVTDLSDDLMKTWAQGLQMLRTVRLLCRESQGLISEFPGTHLEQLTLRADGNMTISLEGLPSSIKELELCSDNHNGAQLSFQDTHWVWQAEHCSNLKELTLNSGQHACGMLHAFRNCAPLQILCWDTADGSSVEYLPTWFPELENLSLSTHTRVI
eukprot:jgi/Chrzof1/11105/Cz05g23240.t1